MIDPGAFVRPGIALVTIVDRTTVRLSADAPESDFVIVAPGTKTAVRLLATGRDLSAVVSRRSPAADPGTRTVHFEIDIADPTHEIPVNTTGEIPYRGWRPAVATEIPPFVCGHSRTRRRPVYIVERRDCNTRRPSTVFGRIQGILFRRPLACSLYHGSHGGSCAPSREFTVNAETSTAMHNISDGASPGAQSKCVSSLRLRFGSTRSPSMRAHDPP